MAVSDLPDDIRRHYTEDYDEDGRIRFGFDRLELERTQQIVRSRVPDRPLRVLDVGGATGVHAEWLLEDGHSVDLVEPVESQIEVARRRLDDESRFATHVGNALALPFPADRFDVVMLMGPLYHLTERADRVEALREARRVLRPGGLVFGAAISRFAGLLDGLERGFLMEQEFRDIVTEHLRTGQHRNPHRHKGWFTTAFFHHPYELAAETAEAGLDVHDVVGVEGPPGLFAHLAGRWDDSEGHAAIMWAAAAVETEPSLLGASPHLLVVAGG